MDCRLQVFKYESTGGTGSVYRFAVVNRNKSTYPANFVCMLPVKLSQGKNNGGPVFNTLFGDKSLGFAMDLINDALKRESDVAVKTELKRRLKLIDPKQINLVKRSRCKKTFQPRKIKA
ncbi:MAG: hypothetical protein NWF01_11520 [Candidatus Bathyarchaeota archaeon]|nr:hypothetical protein [Candidatus Bathyarchaeota archaeon]